jgi:hypothetical protein
VIAHREQKSLGRLLATATTIPRLATSLPRGNSSGDAAGEVYKLRNLSQVPGSYAQASNGFVVGSTTSSDLWMQG